MQICTDTVIIFNVYYIVPLKNKKIVSSIYHYKEFCQNSLVWVYYLRFTANVVLIEFAGLLYEVPRYDIIEKSKLL